MILFTLASCGLARGWFFDQVVRCRPSDFMREHARRCCPDIAFVVVQGPADGSIRQGPQAAPRVRGCEAQGTACQDAASKDFVRDAFAHCKYIAYSPDALGIADELDDGCVAVRSAAAISEFVGLCGKLRIWAREHAVDMDA